MYLQIRWRKNHYIIYELKKFYLINKNTYISKYNINVYVNKIYINNITLIILI